MRIQNISELEDKVFADLINDDGAVIIQATLPAILRLIKVRGYLVEGVTSPFKDKPDEKLVKLIGDYPKSL